MEWYGNGDGKKRRYFINNDCNLASKNSVQEVILMAFCCHDYSHLCYVVESIFGALKTFSLKKMKKKINEAYR